MSQKNRKSADNLSPDGTRPVGVRRSSSIISSRKQSNGNQSPEAEVEGEQLNQSLASRMSLREQTVSEDHLDRSDSFIDSHAFLKYNKTFHKLFSEIPKTEKLTHIFTCSLQREVLFHGKLFVSECHLCFYSSVLLKETKVVIPISSVKEIKKYNSALSMLFVQTSSGDKYSFASLRNYKFCYKLLQRVCSQAKEGSRNGSLHLDSAGTETERDTVSSCSSLEGSIDQDFSSVELDGGFPLIREAPSTSSSSHHSSLKDEDHRAVWLIWRIAKKVSPFVFIEVRNFSMLFYIYVVLLLLLLLVSTYIGLRITALEEQLSSLGALLDLSSHYKEYQDT